MHQNKPDNQHHKVDQWIVMNQILVDEKDEMIW